MTTPCLDGLRVLDLTQYIPGPLATLWLSDLGAQVVKVEPPAGDPMRVMGPTDADGTTFFYKLVNRNKTVVTLDLKSAEGKERMARLLAGADVLVEAYRPGVMERLGFDAATLARLNPRLIHCSISGYGQTGPHALRAGHDMTYAALAGQLAANGIAARPVMTFPPLADHAGAMLALNAVLAALLRRATSGRGARLDVSLAEAALSWMGGVLTAAHRGQPERREQGQINGGAAYYRLYRAGCGGFIAVAPIEAKFWTAFCDAIGRPHWSCRQAEPLPQNDLIGDLERLFLEKSRDEWMALLAPADCCCEPVLDACEVLNHPQWQARDTLRRAGDGDDVVDAPLPLLLDGAPPPPRQPLRQQDADWVLAQW